MTSAPEHLNEAGADLVAAEMAAALGPWVTQRSGAASLALEPTAL